MQGSVINKLALGFETTKDKNKEIINKIKNESRADLPPL